MEVGKKKMLDTLVGCNYASTENELQGCINNAHAMSAVLLNRFGFAPGDVTVLTDDHESGADGVVLTGATIKRTLAEMVARMAPGDVLFFFSGHGTLVPPISDHNVVIYDRPDIPTDPDLHAHAVHAARFLTYAAVLGHLSAASGLDASHHVADHLLVLFGADASAKYRSGAVRTDAADAGILLSLCQMDELSLEVSAECGRPAYGAFTGAVLAAHPARMSNRELVCRAREVLGEQEFQQHPCLYCSDANADAPFLGQQETKSN